jgi:LysR family hydrogen peroxide-inducible transcriptional activator
VAAEQMDREDLILLEDGHCLRDHALLACGLERRRAAGEDGFAATSLATLVQMVGSGLGVSLLPAMAIEAGLAKSAEITVRPVAPGETRRQIVVAWRAGSKRSEEGRLLAEVFAAGPAPGVEAGAP